MASEYGYTNVAVIEARGNWDFSALVEPIADTVTEANISQSERDINIKCNRSFTAPLPDAVVFVAIEATYARMYNLLTDMGLMDRENPRKKHLPTWEKEWDVKLKPFLKTNSNERMHYVKV